MDDLAKQVKAYLALAEKAQSALLEMPPRNATSSLAVVNVTGQATSIIRAQAALLAEAERLCMEHCPDEMSEALRKDWEDHQQTVSAGRKAAIDTAAKDTTNDH